MNSVRGLALLSALLIAFMLGGTSHRIGHDYAGGFSRLDALDMRALGLGSTRRHGLARNPAELDPMAAEPGLKSFGKNPPTLQAEKQNIARFIASRYRVALDQTQFFVENAYRIAREMRLDPWLILAVISVESSFDPRAQSHQGAQGLMQVLTRVHAEKFEPFGGVAAAFDPVANIKVGTQILREYIGRAGSIEGALKFYVGAAALPDDGGYAAKVLSERDRIAAAAAEHRHQLGAVRLPR